jgi:predicted nucleotidyltransferase
MTLELDKLANLARANLPGIRFITVSGAHLYGFPSEDSDIDLRGCYQLPLEDLVGLRRPVETRDPKLDLAGREVELVAHEIGKYLRLLCKHNGYILEQVFSPLVVLGEDFLDRLRPLARRCITKGCYRHYRGFLQAQLKLLEKEEVK